MNPEPDAWAILYESRSVYAVGQSKHNLEKEFTVGGLNQEDHEYTMVPLFRAGKLVDEDESE